MNQRGESIVLLLCTGNYYRSRFAEILFNSVVAKMGLLWRASSRGLALEGALTTSAQWRGRLSKLWKRLVSMQATTVLGSVLGLRCKNNTDYSPTALGLLIKSQALG